MSEAGGDADLAEIASAIADESRARMLLALADGRALPASLLASEAGVARSTASGHLGRLVDAGLLSAHTQGRHRYFRLKGPEVAAVIEAIARVSRPMQVRSLKQGTRAHALRQARTCYDHLAGRLGVAICRALIDLGDVTGGDGVHRIEGGGEDMLAAAGSDISYRLTVSGRARLVGMGVELPRPDRDGTTPLRYCVDWTEQRHHISGAVGRALAARLLELGWTEHRKVGRALLVTAAGERGLAGVFGVETLG